MKGPRSRHNVTHRYNAKHQMKSKIFLLYRVEVTSAKKNINIHLSSLVISSVISLTDLYFRRGKTPAQKTIVQTNEKALFKNRIIISMA